MTPHAVIDAADYLNRPAADRSKEVAEVRARVGKAPAAEVIAELGKLFPDLKGAPGLAPWDPKALDAWAASGKPGTGTVAVVRFLFAVWNGSEDTWKVGPFRLGDLYHFDRNGRAVFAAWSASPFWL